MEKKNVKRTVSEVIQLVPPVVDHTGEPNKPSLERSVTFYKSTKPLSMYRNLVDIVKEKNVEHKPKAKDEEKKEAVEFDENKYHHHKVNKNLTEQLLEKEAEQIMAGNMQRPLNIVINNIFQLGNPNIQGFSEENLMKSYADAKQVNLSFINRFRNSQDDGDTHVTATDMLQGVPFRHLIFNKHLTLTKKAFLSHLMKVQTGLLYAKHHIKPPDETKVATKAVSLEPIPEGMKTLVLDLDDTLVHVVDQGDQGHVALKIKIREGELKTFGIRFRPYLHYFLEKVSRKFEIIVFTASHANYASAVVDYIDPERKFIKYIISRDRCLMTKNGFYIKDLRVLSNRDLKDILIVDNLAHSFCLQVDNGIPILDYQNDPDDKELKYLAKYLLKCAESGNLQEFNKNYMRLEQLVDLNLASVFERSCENTGRNVLCMRKYSSFYLAVQDKDNRRESMLSFLRKL